MIVEISPDISDADAAALMIPAHTGYHTVVRRGAVTEGEVVAVRGAAGGLGAACVQIAGAVGARVVAIVGGTDAVDKAEFCRSIGADEVIDHTTGDVAAELRRSRTVAVSTSSSIPCRVTTRTAVRAGLRVGGRHVLCGHAGGLPPIDPHFYLHNHTLVGVNLAGYGPVEMRRMHAETQAAIEELMAARRVRSTRRASSTSARCRRRRGPRGAADHGAIVVRTGQSVAPATKPARAR